jgi:archaetidylinositol phosphate synthase
MVLDNQRKNVDPLLNRFAKFFIKVNPNLLSLISVIFALLAGIFFYFSSPDLEHVNFYLYYAALFVFLNGFFDAIDGKVAKLTNKATAKGDFIDHAFDRFADVLILGGLAVSPWCNEPAVGLVAVAGMLLTSYMGTQAQAVGAKRNYSGLLGRADRLVFLMVAPIIQHILLIYFPDLNLPLGWSLLCWILVYFAIVGCATAVQRFISTLIWLNKK